MFRLENHVRPYAWGSTTAIAQLLGYEPSGEPEAELWMGAHPGAPSVVGEDQALAGRTLVEVIEEDPSRLLGSDVADRFEDRLPFLMKVLAANEPLSLQVHPTTEQAQAGFDAEEESGVEIDAPHRNYKDRQHKPEVICALTDFEALSGFRDPIATADILAAALDAGAADPTGLIAELVEVLRGPEGDAADDPRLRAAFALLLADRERTAAAAQALAEFDVELVTDEARASLRTAVDLQERYPGDPGVLLSVLLNRVSLRPGEAIYLGAGNVHAYLSGLGIEVMASSDNVLRGGLTSKHVDVDELLSTVRFQALGIPMLPAIETAWGQRVFAPPFEEFAIQSLDFGRIGGSGGSGDDSVSNASRGDDTSGAIPVLQNGPALVLVTSGAIVLDSPRGSLALKRGDSAFIGADEAPVVARDQGDGSSTAWVATVAAS